jgi:hypothetical protein
MLSLPLSDTERPKAVGWRSNAFVGAIPSTVGNMIFTTQCRKQEIIYVKSDSKTIWQADAVVVQHHRQLWRGCHSLCLGG